MKECSLGVPRKFCKIRKFFVEISLNIVDNIDTSEQKVRRVV